jgi:hypothetical protein
MSSRPLAIRRSLTFALTLALSGLPALAAAAEPPAIPPRQATPIADSAARAATMQRYSRGRDGNAALKWTGFGLVVGGASLIALGAVLDDEDCFQNDLGRYDCDTARKGAFLAGGIMAGTGVGLLVMAAHSDHGGRRRGRGRYPDITMQRGRMLLQERITF